MATGDGYVGLFKVPQSGSIIPVLNNTVASGFQVEEVAVVTDAQGGGVSSAKCSFSSIEVTTGEVTGVIIAYRKTADSATTDWITKVFPVSWPASSTYSQFFYIEGLESDWGNPTAVSYDFKAWAINSEGERVVDSNGDSIGPADTATATITAVTNVWSDTSVAFDGISDTAQLAEVTTLVCLNAPPGGSDGGSPTPYNLPIDQAYLQWDDMTKKSTGTYPLADGTTTSIQRYQWKTLVKYVVYMYVATDSDDPQYEYPTTNDTNGTWYEVLETSDTTCRVNLPHTKNVGFWVGAFLKGGIKISSIEPS